MITAVEQGRKLIITVGDGGDGSIVIPVSPVNAKTGAAIFALWVGVLFAQSEQLLVDAQSFSKTAVGEENWDVLDNELRWAEAEQVINAAFFWQTQGGTIELVDEFLDGGYPKARDSLLKANGMTTLWTEFSELMKSPDGASVNPTPSPDDTPDTSTPSGTESSSVSALDRLPSSKKSIRQNENP